MANTFEMTVAALVEHRLASEHPNLGQYRKGFVLLDFNEEEQQAFGVYRLQMGTVAALLPIVYRKGELEPMDIIIIRDLKMYVPAIDGWINLIATSGTQDLGQLMDKQGKGKTPSQVMLQLRDFPYAIKTAKTELSDAEYAALTASLTVPDEVAATAAFNYSPLKDLVNSSGRCAAVLTKAAEASPSFREKLCDLHGDAFVAAGANKAELWLNRDKLLSRKASPLAPPIDKIQVIADIADPRAVRLKGSEKRKLLQKGQFIVDHRAEAETSLVYRSPEALVFQTCPGAGRWRLLTSDGELVHVETFIPEPTYRDPAANPRTSNQLPRDTDPEINEVWVVPANGAAPFKHVSKELYLKTPTLSQDKWPEVGQKAIRSVFRELAQKWQTEQMDQTKKLADKNAPADVEGIQKDIVVPESWWGEFLIMGNGKAVCVSLQIPGDDKTPLIAGDKQLIFTNAPGRLRFLEDRIMIPNSARVILMKFPADVQRLSLGRPSDLAGKIRREEKATDLTVRLNGPLYDMTGAINKMARPENEAMKDLVYGAGIQASVAAGILSDARQRPGEDQKYLVRQAFVVTDPDEDRALSGLQMAPEPQQNAQFMDPAQLQQQGNTLAKSTTKTSEEDIDKKSMDELLTMTDFREVNADLVKNCMLTMDQMGQMLLRMLLHRQEYEDRYGQEDAERLQNKFKDTFMNTGDLALVLREKRGNQGLPDDERALAGMVSADMGA